MRKTLPKGIAFLAHVIIAAEKGMSDRLSYSSLFNLQETKVKNLIIVMIGEGIDGCELFLSSFIVMEYIGRPIPAG